MLNFLQMPWGLSVAIGLSLAALLASATSIPLAVLAVCGVAATLASRLVMWATDYDREAITSALNPSHVPHGVQVMFVDGDGSRHPKAPHWPMNVQATGFGHSCSMSHKVEIWRRRVAGALDERDLTMVRVSSRERHLVSDEGDTILRLVRDSGNPTFAKFLDSAGADALRQGLDPAAKVVAAAAVNAEIHHLVWPAWRRFFQYADL